MKKLSPRSDSVRHLINQIFRSAFVKCVVRLGIMIAAFHALSGFAEDDLNSLKATIQSDFGVGSTIWTILYLTEILVAIYTYIKTKNVGMFLGILVISVFSTFALNHWVFTS